MAESIDWEWYQKKEFMNRLGSTMKPSEVNPKTTLLFITQVATGLFGTSENKELQNISQYL